MIANIEASLITREDVRCGPTPMQTLIDGKEAWDDKITALNGQT